MSREIGVTVHRCTVRVGSQLYAYKKMGGVRAIFVKDFSVFFAVALIASDEWARPRSTRCCEWAWRADGYTPPGATNPRTGGHRPKKTDF